MSLTLFLSPLIIKMENKKQIAEKILSILSFLSLGFLISSLEKYDILLLIPLGFLTLDLILGKFKEIKKEKGK